jgi:hypothetical protein
MDLQSGPNFRINNVSRAALSSIGVLPEFAQLTIIARFCRAPMESIHNKNGHLLSLLSEFLRDNPHVENLKPVSTFVGDNEQDPGLFEYGYAPPYPTNGLSTVPVPYHHDETAKETVDEFGRAAHQRPSDPRRARREDKSQEQGGLLTSGKPTDPRRRNAPALGGIAAYDKSDTFHHLPRSVQAVLEDIYNSGKLPEAINDSVIARLLKLPEYIAVRAAESFRKVDIGKIENLQGFLVGIINRVHERALAAEAAEGRNQYGGGNKRAPASVYQDPQPSSVVAAGGDYKYNYNPPQQDYVGRSSTYRFSDKPGHQAAILALPVSVQNHLVQLAQSGVLTSVDEFGEKCYEVLNQLTEDLANEVLKRFGSTNLTQVRNRSGFLIGVVKRVRQEFNYH